ncbi:hypothetical protein ACFU96_06400 [Streptomyces sp. NPDC057620]|uniref:hypothetical protein n=1 Tax=Streptomyces sp. NPDC057620 TaxID=3346185 RepID=UPI0036A352B1
MTVLLAVGLSLVSAVCYATAAVVQERTAAGTASLRSTLARPSWWGSVALNGGGALLHVVALRFGPLTLVQPLGALSLVVAVPLGALVTRRRTSRAQWRGMALTLVGLVALLAATASGGAPVDTLGTGEVLLVSLAAAGALVALVRLGGSGRRAGGGATPGGGLALAAASGIASGVGSTLAQKLAVGSAPSWSLAAVAVLTVGFATAGVLLSQKAYRSGLGGPLAVLTLVNPVAASAIGITLLGEGVQYGGFGGLGGLLALVGAVAAARGVVLLSLPQARSGTETGQEVFAQDAQGVREVQGVQAAGAEGVGKLTGIVNLTGMSRAAL